MNWQVQKDARSSAAGRRMAQKAPRLGIARTRELMASIDPERVDWICHLGNRIVGRNAGERFVLR